jgi:hypothetical protein
MWGKLDERALRSQTTMIFEPQELYRFFTTPGVKESSLLFVNDQAVWISWIHSDESHALTLKHANDVASYVKTGARMHLYKYLDNYKKRPSIVTPILSSIFSLEANRVLEKRGTV